MQVKNIRRRYNISIAAEVDKLKAVFDRLPEFLGYRDGKPYWFGEYTTDGAYLALSIDTSCDPVSLLRVDGRLTDSDWNWWNDSFVHQTSIALGYLVMEAEADPSFRANGTPFLRVAPYQEQCRHWPVEGRHIMAQYDDQSVVVYQAYRLSIGRFAHQSQRFGGDFSFNRMSWIKPNFLWMMYRCGWGTKSDQEVTLAIKLKRSAFDEIIAQAVHSSFQPDVYPSHEDWQKAVAGSDVRLQWDPDHDPSGAVVKRRAIQLGMRGSVLVKYGGEWLVGICDISEFVALQHKHVGNGYKHLITPSEAIYPVTNESIIARLGL